MKNVFLAAIVNMQVYDKNNVQILRSETSLESVSGQLAYSQVRNQANVISVYCSK